MRFLRSPLGVSLILLALAVAGLFAVAFVQVGHVLRPPRHRTSTLDFEMVRLEVQDVRFRSLDGVELAGWLVRGRGDFPPIVLGHDFGSSKASLTQLASSLHREGFTLLLIDFRGHGESGAAPSTLGVDEKRDLLGAIDYLATEQGMDIRQVGLYGVGMGAHAAVLAAAEQRRATVLVLDGLYPDAGYPLAREVWSDWSFGVRRLAFMPRALFALLANVSVDDQRAADALAGLTGRHLLLVAPESDPALAEEMKQMYRAIPDQLDADGNLVYLPATIGEGLYGDELSRYHDRVTGFFRNRLQPRSDNQVATGNPQ